jgi:hypothetical protein
LRGVVVQGRPDIQVYRQKHVLQIDSKGINFGQREEFGLKSFGPGAKMRTYVVFTVTIRRAKKDVKSLIAEYYIRDQSARELAADQDEMRDLERRLNPVRRKGD